MVHWQLVDISKALSQVKKQEGLHTLWFHSHGFLEKVNYRYRNQINGCLELGTWRVTWVLNTQGSFFGGGARNVQYLNFDGSYMIICTVTKTVHLNE